MARLPSWTAALALGLAPVGLLGQAGDRRNEPASEQERLWEDIDVPPAPALPPDQALETFHLEPGFRIELVASEPMVEDPIAVTWDEAGRMWVVEMQSFMPNADGEGEDEPISRIMVLEDLDGDGAMDRSTPFLEGLVMPRAIAIVEGGVLVAEPPGLYYCQDLDGDLRCDKKTKVADYAATGNVEHSENGLLRGIDNWLYNAKSNRRLKFDPAKAITVEPTNSRGQWGLTMDDYGRLFYNHNSAYLLADLIPWEFAAQNPILRPSAGFDVDPVKSREVFSARVNPGVNRAYRDNWLRDDYRLWKVTGVSGLAINRGVRYPKEYYGNVFVPEVTANAVARLTLEDEGLSVSAEHPLTEHPDWDKVEFLTSTDERFRPVSAAMGPDGFIYIVDMYRGASCTRFNKSGAQRRITC